MSEKLKQDHIVTPQKPGIDKELPADGEIQSPITI